MTETCSRELTFPTSVALPVLYGISGLFTVFGNAIVLRVIYKTRALRTVSNLLLASLAVADLLVGLIIDPLWIFRCLLRPYPYNHPFKIAIDSLWIQTSVTTTFTLCAVSLDRYIAVRYVYRYYQIATRRKCCVVILLVWISSIVFSLSRVLTTNPSHLPRLWLSVTVTTILLPTTLIIYCQGLIFKSAKEQSTKIAHETVHNTQFLTQKALNRKAAQTVGFVVAVFLVSWIPSLITSFVHLASNDVCFNREMRLVWLWVELVAFTSSAINPWLYSLRNREFREAMRRAIGIGS